MIGYFHGGTITAGWRAAKWGMTEADVFAAFAGEAVRLDKPEPLPARFGGAMGRVAIQKYEIQSTPYTVLFGFDDKGALSLVRIGPVDTASGTSTRSRRWLKRSWTRCWFQHEAIGGLESALPRSGRGG